MAKKSKPRTKSAMKQVLDKPLSEQVQQHEEEAAQAGTTPYQQREPYRGLNTEVGEERWAPSMLTGPDGLNDFERHWLRVFKESGDPEYAARVAYRLDQVQITPTGKASNKTPADLAKQISTRNKKKLAKFYQDRWERLGITDDLVHHIVVDAATACKTGLNQRTGQVVISELPDHETRMKAAKLAMDLRGLKAPTKSTVEHNVNMSAQLTDVLSSLDTKNIDKDKDVVDGEFTEVTEEEKNEALDQDFLAQALRLDTIERLNDNES